MYGTKAGMGDPGESEFWGSGQAAGLPSALGLAVIALTGVVVL